MAQAANVRAEIRAAFSVGVSPHLLMQQPVGDDFAYMPRQHFQQLPLGSAQWHLLPAAPEVMGLEVDF